MQLKKLLIPVDFSEYSELAAQKAISLAQMYQAMVYFLHVGEEAEDSATQLSKFIQGLLPETSKRIKKLVAQGKPASVILAAAKRIQADMIVMGTRGASGLKYLMQGSIAEKVLREANCPVLLIKKTKQSEFSGYVMPQIRSIEEAFQADKILVPLDFSTASKQAFYYASALASRYNSTIYTLTVFDKKYKEYNRENEKHTTIEIRNKKIRLWKEFPRLLNATGYPPASLRVKRLLLAGDPYARIESLVEKKEIDLVIMGTNGRSGFEHLLSGKLGSVAEKVLRNVDSAVMTIRSQDAY